MSQTPAAAPFSARTAWTRALSTPYRAFLRTETGSAAVLLAGAAAALIWANVDAGSYESVWHTTLAVRLGGSGVTQDLRGWVNDGLMTLFFFVVGLEARREFDMGELRERQRVTLPFLAGLAGMIVPVLLFLAVNAGRSSAHGWGTAMSTDTAFALGMLALVGRRLPDRLRAFMLTVVVVDDLVALVVIAVAYSRDIAFWPLLAAIALFAGVLLLRALKVGGGVPYALLGVAVWIALFHSGVDPVVIGLAMGLLTTAYPAARTDLEQASERFRLFREQPTPELARLAREGVASALSPNERLQQNLHPWTSYAIVPLFALVNAGIPVGGGFLGNAFTSPITLGILLAYVVGKPVGIVGTAYLATRLSQGRLRPPVGWAAVAGGGAIAGIGFTVSLLIASLAFTGTQLQQAKAGVLAAALVASVASWVVFRLTDLLPHKLRNRLLFGTSESIVDLADPVDPDTDHLRGPKHAAITLVEYGDLECPYCGQAEPIVRELLSSFGDLRYVWRHLPLTDVHPRAQLAAEATEAAAEQGAFWLMHDLLLTRQDALSPKDLVRYAGELDLDVDRFTDYLHRHSGSARIAQDVDSADLSGVSGTPTFFVNGRRHFGAYDIDALTAAVRDARAQAAVLHRH
ncbi:MAG TPA: Na+/H+ antiporter NhaA [Mycobacteriales bacterium]|jgi:Na+/H+ antiporter NhaA|nr:Na+/H+ antiporter NhaA [Mycobacteriales bacterium]